MAIRTAAATAMLALAAVTTPSIANIWRSVARLMPPSAIAIAPAMQAIVSAPLAIVATYSASHIRGSVATASPAIARVITNATQTASASWARLKPNLISGSRRIP